MILIDNCQNYLCKIILEYMKKTNKVSAFLSKYTPTFAPIELLFGKLKYLLSQSPEDKITSCRSMIGEKLI